MKCVTFTQVSFLQLAEESCNEPQPPEVAVSPASPLESKQDTTADKATSGPKVSNGTIPRGPKSPGTPESRRRFPFPFKKDLSPLMRRRKHTKTKSIDNVTGTVHRDSLIEDGSVSDSNDEETGMRGLCKYYACLQGFPSLSSWESAGPPLPKIEGPTVKVGVLRFYCFCHIVSGPGGLCY